MTDAEILGGIAEIARRELGWEGPVRREMRLVEELNLDSLKLLTLAVAVENRFRVRLGPEDEAELETVADLIGAVRRNQG